jgi:hypothetical protein
MLCFEKAWLQFATQWEKKNWPLPDAEKGMNSREVSEEANHRG